MKIALDYDGTYTRDPPLWEYFLGMCRARGHEVKIVTCRKPENEIDWFDLPEKFRVPVLYTSHIPKRIYCDEIGWQPEIWIDDIPELIVRPDFQKFVEAFGAQCETAEESKKEVPSSVK